MVDALPIGHRGGSWWTLLQGGITWCVRITFQSSVMAGGVSSFHMAAYIGAASGVATAVILTLH